MISDLCQYGSTYIVITITTLFYTVKIILFWRYLSFHYFVFHLTPSNDTFSLSVNPII